MLALPTTIGSAASQDSLETVEKAPSALSRDERDTSR
jgi:hypothetical protein